MKLTLPILIFILVASCTPAQRASLPPIKVFYQGDSGNIYGYSTKDGIEIEIENSGK